jgi:hypothetical protein
VISEVGTAPAIGLERRTTAVASAATAYDLLLVALLGFMAAARLWLVPGYLRGDTWLALAAGRDVWAGGVPHQDTLTAIAAGERWVDQQWLAHLATYELDRLGGLGLVAALSALLAAASFAAMAAASRALGARPRAVLLIMPVTAFPFFAQSWQPRTQMFAYPLFAAVFLLLLNDSRRPSPRVLLVLPLLALLANLHGSAALGAGLIVLRGLVLLAERRAAARAWALVAAPLLLLATPYGLSTSHYYRATLLDPTFKRLATEWQPITHDPLLLVPFVALALLAAWSLLRARDVTTRWERMALVILLVGAATAVRNMVWLTLGAVPVLALALDKVVPPAQPQAAGLRMNRVLAAGAAAACLIAAVVTVSRPTSAFERDYPTGYLTAVQRAAAADPSARIVADVGDADWLLWRDPALRGRVAFDARLELLSAAGIRDIASLLRGSRDSGLRAGAYRIFALDPHTAGPTVRVLRRTRGVRVLFSSAHRLVLAAR